MKWYDLEPKPCAMGLDFIRFFVYLILVFKDEAEEYGEARRADDR